ncbi:hypothetical protein MSG28_010020 [Choristoneura fumiferana]|uniref:Uncharacterized protein n=1 Tax=Choristoneura fumiferana TaxID=7141 RepID=A0ACC0KIZ4_CHOFU|nr:hypothetical protein MSG28_010020 [Choristoneura fumiferana]
MMFSFAIKLVYIEGGELSRAWKLSRRQRLKELESKIWQEFVKEQDVVSSVCSDDPYQFLEKLPDECLKELMEAELRKMRKENVKEEPKETVSEHPEQAVEPPEPRETTVTFAEESEHEACEMIHIFDDEKDESFSGPEQEATNESTIESPCTVRGRDSPDPERPENNIQVTEKSSENVRTMIETSIYSAKVKELQSKVLSELLNIITTLDAQDLNKIEPQDLPKLQRQCSEFCARYTRIYLYQLKRQIHDITRHNNTALPFARHTFLRTQMARAVSLHQNMLQSLQIFHKWFTQKAPLRECVECLKTLTQLVRDSDIELLQTCQNLDTASGEYLQRVINYLNLESTATIRLKKKSSVGFVRKKRPIGMWAKPGYRANSEPDAKLSMYSLDTLRVNSKPSSSRDSGCTSKARLVEADTNSKPEDATQKKKTPRSRRPLMRAPGGVQRKREKQREDNIPTMVEAVEVVINFAYILL